MMQRMTPLLPLTLIILAGVVVGPASGAAGPRQPDFSRYRVDARFSGTPAPPDLKSGKDARRFRTVLREGARSGPNFAGHFTVVTWGCGTMCQSHAIVDAHSGRVTMISFPSAYGIEYRLESRLLVFDPSDECLPAGTIGPETSEWYEWAGGKLRKVDSVRIVSPCE